MTLARRILLAILVAEPWIATSGAGPTGTLQGEAHAPQAEGESGVTGWITERLDLDVVPLPEEGKLALEGELLARLTGVEPAPGPTFGLNRELFRLVDAEASGVRLEEQQGIGPLASALFLHARRDEPFAPGSSVRLRFACESIAMKSQFQIGPDCCFASWVTAWYPLVFRAGNSLSGLGSVPGVTRFHLPPGWDAVSNGRRLEAQDGVIAFEVDPPVARSFAAGPYRAQRHRVGERDIGVYLLTEPPVPVEKQVATLAAALAAQEARFGPYPYPSYAVVEIPEGRGEFYASSEQGFLMAKSEAFAWDHGNLPLWAHEMAHGWWGNLVAGDGPGSILCNESLAQYSAVIAIETIEGGPAATEFLRFSRSGYSSRQCARGYFEMARAGLDEALSRLDGSGWQHDLADAKGHWVYHMLRRRIGDERFFRGLRELLAAYSGREMTLADVRRRFEELAPEEGLGPFFAQWLDRTGAPVIDVAWTDLGAGRVEVVLTQVQAGEPYDLRLPVEVSGAAGTARAVVALRERETRVVLDSPGAPQEVRVDPDHELLIWHPEYGERP